MKKIVTGILALALSTGAALAADKSITADDQKFMDMAARAGKLEIKLGKLAEANAKAAAVKKFGAEMIHDHEKASAELKSLAYSRKPFVVAF
jgi:predicted outer membrane protein